MHMQFMVPTLHPLPGRKVQWACEDSGKHLAGASGYFLQTEFISEPNLPLCASVSPTARICGPRIYEMEIGLIPLSEKLLS